MITSKISFIPKLNDFIQSLDLNSIPGNRKVILQSLIDYTNEKLANHEHVNLNFICTHNSRRSQFAQVWAQVAAAYQDAENIHCFSGGTEVTAFNPRAAEALKRDGLHITNEDGENPVYTIHFSEKKKPLQCFSKAYDHPDNPNEHFAAVMTCSQADENCPFITGLEKRIALNYDDPKELDRTPREAEEYNARSRQIATEMFYVFEKIKK